MVIILLVIVVSLALIFEFINGFHDAANSIATIVTTKVLTPFQAILWASAFNFLAYFIIKDHQIANTIAKTVNEQFITMTVIASGLIAAIAWNLVTWWFAVPSSSSHALIGGFSGAGMAHAFFAGSSPLNAVNVHTISIIALYIILSPLIGLGIAYVLFFAIKGVSARFHLTKSEAWFRGAQLLSSAALSFGHGSNDAQKVMGIIYVALVASKIIDNGTAMPGWIPFACYAAIALGTMSGGWKIVETIGKKITIMTPLKGVSVETAGAITLLITERFGIPVSTTHTVTGAVIGAGLTEGVSAVHWKIITNLLWAWIITIPMSALVAAAIYAIAHGSGIY